jgi:hypothetical protein
MAGELWGLYQCRLVRDADQEVLFGDRKGWNETVAAMRAAVAVSGTEECGGIIAAVPLWGFGVERLDKTIRADADGRRCRDSENGRRISAHEVSSQKDAWPSAGRGSVPRSIIAPPQHGQTLKAMPLVA